MLLMNKNCETCPEIDVCKLLGEKCPRIIGREIPFSDLAPVSDLAPEIEMYAKPSSEIFCGSPDHTFKREARVKAATSTLDVKSIAAITLLASTDYPFSILEVSEITGLSERQIYYLRAKIKK